MITDTTESLSDILKHAIRAEILACRFYTRGYQSTVDGELIALFQSLTQDEMRHEDKLRNLYKVLIGEDAPKDLLDPETDVVPPIADAPEAVLRSAMEREERARNYYRFLAAQVDGHQAKDLLAVLESEEQRHYDLLEMELNARQGEPWAQVEMDNWVRDD